jgi:hypothetical protein
MTANSPDALALHSVYEILLEAGRRARQEAEERTKTTKRESENEPTTDR